MAYTTPWSEILNLLGSRSAHEIDDASREARAGLEERFASILYDVGADPWVLKVPGLALDGSRSYNIPANSATVVTTNTFVREAAGIRPAVAGEAITVIVPLQITQGTDVRAFGIAGTRSHAGASVVANLIVIVDNAPTTLATITLAATTGFQTVSSGVIDHFVTQADSLYVEVIIDSDVSGAITAQLHSVRVSEIPAGAP